MDTRSGPTPVLPILSPATGVGHVMGNVNVVRLLEAMGVAAIAAAARVLWQAWGSRG